MLAFQQNFNQLSNRASSSGLAGDEICFVLQLCRAITDCCTHSCKLQASQIGQIIPNETELLRGVAQLAKNFFDDRQFIFVTLPHEVQPKFIGSHSDDV